MKELLDVYTYNKKRSGAIKVRGERFLAGEYHLVVVSLVFNPERQLLMTRRSKDKTFAGKWETTAGSVIAGETGIVAMKRELAEEIGIALEVGHEHFVHSFIDGDGIFEVYRFHEDVRLSETILQASEVDAIKYVRYREFEEMMERGEVVPNLSVIFELRKSDVISFD